MSTNKAKGTVGGDVSVHGLGICGKEKSMRGEGEGMQFFLEIKARFQIGSLGFGSNLKFIVYPGGNGLEKAATD